MLTVIQIVYDPDTTIDFLRLLQPFLNGAEKYGMKVSFLDDRPDRDPTVPKRPNVFDKER